MVGLEPKDRELGIFVITLSQTHLGAKDSMNFVVERKAVHDPGHGHRSARGNKGLNPGLEGLDRRSVGVQRCQVGLKA